MFQKIQKLLNSLQWPIYFINSNDNTKLPCYTLPPTQHHSFFRNLPLCSTDLHNCFQSLISHRSIPLIDQFCYPNLTQWEWLVILSYLSSNSFWKEKALKRYMQNAAIYHHLAGWNEKMPLRKNTNKELNCVLEWPRMATYDFCLGTFIGMYP